MPKQCSEGIDETTSDLIKLFTLRDAADPGFKVLVPEGHKPRNPSTRGPQSPRTSEIEPPNPQSQNRQTTKNQERKSKQS